MAIKRIERVTCGLNLGSIYSFSYNYTPDSGVTITISFVNASGEYAEPNLLPIRKVNISIGSASFSMYPVSYRSRLSSGSRVIDVDFVDETHQLDNYYITLTGKGCGDRVYALGRSVDSRSPTQINQDSLDPVAQQIKEFTQFSDVQYTFTEFLNTLRKVFNIQLLATLPVSSNFDSDTNANSFVGTFREVLDSWCNFLGFSYFFENGILKIFDPTKLIINLPSMPTDAIDFSKSEDITETYGKTAFNYIQLEGGQFELSETSDSGNSDENDGGPIYKRSVTLYPVGYELGLQKTTLALDQVSAAQYGPEFWFLYNFYKGSVSQECGWNNQVSPPDPNSTIAQSITAAGANFATINMTVFEEKYQAYYQYGTSIAGRWYISSAKSDLEVDETYSWFDVTSSSIFNFSSDFAATLQVSPKYLYEVPPLTTSKVVEGTEINQYFPGVNYSGKRMALYDPKELDETQFSLTTAQKNVISDLYSKLFLGLDGSRSMDFSSLVQNQYIGYNNISFPQDIQDLFKEMSRKGDIFKPSTTSKQLNGIKSVDYISLKQSQNEPNDVQVVTTQGPNVVGNTSVIKTLQNGAYVIYYNKYQKCASAASNGTYFGHRFEPRETSEDTSLIFNFRKLSNNTYSINRDLSVINNLVNENSLRALVSARGFPTKTVSFSLNYFRDIPHNFLTNGLTSMSVSIGSDGVSSTYEFSNSVLRVPDGNKSFAAVQQQVRNSWIRKYQPKEVIN